MKCPRCERGTIKKVILKRMGERAYLCDSCEMFWFEKEEIRDNTGHPFDTLTQGNAIEYTIDSTEENDPESTPIEYTHVK